MSLSPHFNTSHLDQAKPPVEALEHWAAYYADEAARLEKDSASFYAEAAAAAEGATKARALHRSYAAAAAALHTPLAGDTHIHINSVAPDELTRPRDELDAIVDRLFTGRTNAIPTDDPAA